MIMFDFNVARTPQNTEYLGIAYTEGEKSAQRGQLLELINLLIGETSVRVTSEAIVKLPTLDIGIDHRKPQQADINKKRVTIEFVSPGWPDDKWDDWR